MVYEVAVIEIKDGTSAEFEAAVKEAAPFFKRSRGCQGMALQRSVETPSCYALIVTWETVEDHMEHFRNAPEFAEWRRLVSPYFAAPPKVQHFSVVESFF